MSSGRNERMSSDSIRGNNSGASNEGRSLISRFKSKNSSWLRSGSTASRYARDVGSREQGGHGGGTASETSFEKLRVEGAFDTNEFDDDASIATATTASTTTAFTAPHGTSARSDMSARPDHSGYSDIGVASFHDDSTIPHHDRHGQALSPAERQAIAKRRGQTSKVGSLSRGQQHRRKGKPRPGRSHMQTGSSDGSFVKPRAATLSDAPVPEIVTPTKGHTKQARGLDRKGSVRFDSSQRSERSEGSQRSEGQRRTRKPVGRTKSNPTNLPSDRERRKELQRHSSEGNVGRQNSPELNQIMKHLAADDYSTFLDEIQNLGPKHSSIVVAALAAFRTRIVSKESPKAVLKSDSWVGAIVATMEGSGSDVLTECLLTFLTFSGLSGFYRKAMVRKGAVKAIQKVLDALHTDSQEKEIACAVMYCLKGYEAKFQPTEETLRNFADVLAAPGGSPATKGYVVRTLHYTAIRGDPSIAKDKARLDTLRSVVTQEKVINGLAEMLAEPTTQHSTAEVVLDLLWRFSTWSGEPNNDVNPSELLINAILSVVDRMEQKSPSMQQAVCGLFANLAINPSFPQTSSSGILKGLHQHMFDPGSIRDPATVEGGLHAICNLISHTSRSLLVSCEVQIAAVAMSSIAAHVENSKVLKLGLPLVSFFCTRNVVASGRFVDEKSLPVLLRCLQSFVIEHRTLGPDMTLAVAFLVESVAKTDAGAKQINQMRVLHTIHDILCHGSGAELVIESFFCNMLLSETYGFQSAECSPPLQSNVDSALDASNHSTTSMNFEPALRVALSGEELGVLMRATNRSKEYEFVQAEVCKLLAEHFSLVAARDEPAFPPPTTKAAASESKPEQCGSPPEILTQACVHNLRRAMRSFPDNQRIQAYACSALSFITATKAIAQDLSPSWISPSLGDVLDVFSLHPKNGEVVKCGLLLIPSLFETSDRQFVEIFGPKIFHQISEAVMMANQIDLEVAELTLDVMIALGTADQENLAFFSSRVGLSFLMESAAEESTSKKAFVLLSWLMSSSARPQERMLVKLSASIGELIGSGLRSSDAQLQSNICLVLKALAESSILQVEENLIAANVPEALYGVLALNTPSALVVVPLCHSLKSLCGSISEDTLLSFAPGLWEKLHEVLEEHSSNEGVCTAAAGVLWASRCPDFISGKQLNLDVSSLKSSVKAVKHHLGCSDLQFHSFRSLGALCDVEQARAVVVGHGGIAATVNCLLVHSDNSELVVLGLVVLKKLAADRSSKPIIAQESAEFAVSTVTSIHYRDPRVLVEAFSTLESIVTDFERGTSSLLSAEYLESIISAMRRFSINGAIQATACRLLRICSSMLKNLETTSHRLADLLPLLFRAAISFPRHCKEAVLTIVNIMAAEFPSLTNMEMNEMARASLEREKSDDEAVFDDAVSSIDGTVFEVEREVEVRVQGSNGVSAEACMYLADRRYRAPHGYQRLEHPARVNPEFATRKINAVGHAVICSRLGLATDGNYYVRQGRDSDLVVVKKIPILGGRDSHSPLDASRRELEANKVLNGKTTGIPTLREVLRDDASLYLVYELPDLRLRGYCTFENMLEPVTVDAIESFDGSLQKEYQARPLFRKLALHIQDIHSAGVCHGNLRPGIILDLGSPHGIFVDDFTHSFSIFADDETSSVLHRRSPSAVCEAFQEFRYVAPEIFHGTYSCGAAMDVWSLGAILFALLTGVELCHQPDDNDSTYKLFVSSSGITDDAACDLAMGKLLFEQDSESRNILWYGILRVKSLSDDARDLLAGMLQPDPECRMELDQVLSHDWLQKSDPGDVHIQAIRGGFPEPDGDGDDDCLDEEDRDRFTTSFGRGGEGKKRGKRQNRRNGRGKDRSNQNKESMDKSNHNSDDEYDSHDDDDAGGRKGGRRGSRRTRSSSSIKEEKSDFMTIVQASPLTYRSNGRFFPMGQLNIHEERRTLMQAIKDAGANIKIIFDIATSDRLGAFLSKGEGRILHFSGHGHPHYLAIEDGWGVMQPLEVGQLKEWVSLGNGSNGVRHGLDFVFVSACYSRSIGDAFVEAGVPHVVCCDQDTQRIRVDTAVAFQKFFYRALACGDYLQKAFDRARHEILNSSILPREDLENEARKYCLLPSGKNHNVPIFFTQNAPASVMQIDSDRRPARLPMPPSIFVGRQVEKCFILRSLQRARLVRITGERGIGKRTLVKSTCRFIYDRRHILGCDEIFWFPSIIKSTDKKLNRLFENLFDVSQTLRERSRDIEKIIQCLYGRRALLVLESSDIERNAFIVQLLEQLYQHNETVKVIWIDLDHENSGTDKSFPCVEASLQVMKLDIESSIILFCNLCPRVGNIKGLCDLLTKAYMEKRLWRHDIDEMIGAGNPRSIQQAAKSISEMDFHKLLEIGKRKALNLKFDSRISLVLKQGQVKEEIAEALREREYIRAGDLQFMHDEIDRLKVEFPDIATLQRDATTLQTKLGRAIGMGMWEEARGIRLSLDRLEERLAAEKLAESKAAADKEEENTSAMSISQLKDKLAGLQSSLRTALDLNDFASAKDINEKIRTYEGLIDERESEESLSSSVHKLEMELEDAKSNLDVDAAQEIYSKLMEERNALKQLFSHGKDEMKKLSTISVNNHF